MQIVGVSFGSPEANTRWAEHEDFNFEVWTDDDRTLALYYGAINNPDALFPKRITKVLDKDGVLVMEYISDVSVGTHPAEVLEDCQQLFR